MNGEGGDSARASALMFGFHPRGVEGAAEKMGQGAGERAEADATARAGCSSDCASHPFAVQARDESRLTAAIDALQDPLVDAISAAEPLASEGREGASGNVTAGAVTHRPSGREADTEGPLRSSGSVSTPALFVGETEYLNGKGGDC